jgi:XTP/dITP diphosphohydrolase
VAGCVVAVGVCPGVILHADQGEGGFGYDAIFAPTEAAVASPIAPDAALRSFAQVPPAVKNALSHRGKAAALIAPFLAAWAA